MRRTLSYRTSDDGSLLHKEDTIVFRLTQQSERGAAELGIAAGERVRVELLDDGGHLLDSLTYAAASAGG